MSILPDVFQRYMTGMAGFIGVLPLTQSDLSQIGNITNTGLELLLKPIWEEKGFSVLPNRNLGVFSGGNILILDGKIFFGEFEAQLEFGRMVNSVHGLRNSRALAEGYARLKRQMLERLSHYDTERKVRCIDHQVEEDLDMFFTPLSGNVVAVGDVRQALSFLRLPSNIRIMPCHQHLERALHNLAGNLAKQYEVVTVPTLPFLYDETKAVRAKHSIAGTSFFGQTMRITWNNVLQERFVNENGENVGRIYVAEYPVPGDVPCPAYARNILRDNFTRLDHERFLELQKMAIGVYRKQGLAVVPVPFFSFYSPDGSLRCSLKVLERI